MGAREEHKHGLEGLSAKTVKDALGRDVLPSDWIDDVELRIGLIFLNPAEKDLSAVFIARFKNRLESSLDNWTKICEKFPVASEGDKRDLGRIAESFERAKQFDKLSGSVLSDAIYDEIDLEKEQIRQDRERIVVEWNALRLRPDFHYSPDRMVSMGMIE